MKACTTVCRGMHKRDGGVWSSVRERCGPSPRNGGTSGGKQYALAAYRTDTDTSIDIPAEKKRVCCATHIHTHRSQRLAGVACNGAQVCNAHLERNARRPSPTPRATWREPHHRSTTPALPSSHGSGALVRHPPQYVSLTIDLFGSPRCLARVGDGATRSATITLRARHPSRPSSAAV